MDALGARRWRILTAYVACFALLGCLVVWFVIGLTHLLRGLLGGSVGNFEFMNSALDLLSIAVLSNIVLLLMIRCYFGIRRTAHPRREVGSPHWLMRFERISIDRELFIAISILGAAEVLKFLLWRQPSWG
jgi:hypothetical protein